MHNDYVSALVAVCTAYYALQIVIFTLHYKKCRQTSVGPFTRSTANVSVKFRLIKTGFHPTSDGVKDVTHEAKVKVKAMTCKAKAMTHKAKAKAKDLTCHAALKP